MNDYSHLRLHDTRVARATTRTRPEIPTVRSRRRWHRLLHTLHAGTDGAQSGFQGPSGTQRPVTDDPETAHSVAGEAGGGIDARSERTGVVRVP
jgi:hypothetical protein